jgi:hypothetical protein
MKKIPTLFVRDPEDRSRVLDEVNPDCQWVIDGEGLPTVKLDGACCMIDTDGIFWKRREVKKGKTAPDDFQLVERDETTGKSVGWVLVDPGTPEDQFFAEAFERLADRQPGTYELVGPKVQGNPEQYSAHRMMPHASLRFSHTIPRTFDMIQQWIDARPIEGIVWHHEDGRMAKIKKRDFGMER